MWKYTGCFLLCGMYLHKLRIQSDGTWESRDFASMSSQHPSGSFLRCCTWSAISIPWCMLSVPRAIMCNLM